VVGSVEIVTQWVRAYVQGRDDDLIALAHEDIVVHPRRGQGEYVYRRLDGVRRWLVSVGKPPPAFLLGSVEVLDDKRVIVEGSIDGVEVVALFEVREDKIIAVSSYMSDRLLLKRLGRI
jgi:SnoaL-like domain